MIMLSWISSFSRAVCRATEKAVYVLKKKKADVLWVVLTQLTSRLSSEFTHLWHSTVIVSCWLPGWMNALGITLHTFQQARFMSVGKFPLKIINRPEQTKRLPSGGDQVNHQKKIWCSLFFFFFFWRSRTVWIVEQSVLVYLIKIF